MTFPLALQLARSVAGWPGDNLIQVWKLWWFKHAVLDLGTSPLHVPLVFAPEGFEFARLSATWANLVLALPLTSLWGPVAAYNGIVLISFVLSGFGTYLWVWRLVGSRSAGLVAGLVFAFCPYRMAHLPGHMALMATQWLPFLLFAVEAWGRTRKPRYAILAGLFFALNAWAAWYYLYFALVAVPVYLLLRYRAWERASRATRSSSGTRPLSWSSQRSRLLRIGWGLGLFATVALSLTVPVAWPNLSLYSAGSMERPFVEMEYWSANPTDFFVPNLLHPVWGRFVREWVPFQWQLWVEKGLSLGIVAIALACVPMLPGQVRYAARGRAGRTHHRKAGATRGSTLNVARTLAGLALVSFLLALGPTLHWAGERIEIVIPPGLMALLYHLGITPYLTPRLDPALLADMQLHHYTFIPLPMLLLYLFVPFTSSLRAVSRFGLVTMLAVAALAGVGTMQLLERQTKRGRRWLVLSLVMSAVLFEFLALPHETTDLEPRAVDLWLANQPYGAIAELPLDDGLRPKTGYYATVHQQASVLGPVGGFFPAALDERRDRLESFPDVKSVDALIEYGVTYLLVHTDRYADWEEQILPWETKGMVQQDRCFEALCVYLMIAPTGAMEPSHPGPTGIALATGTGGLGRAAKVPATPTRAGAGCQVRPSPMQRGDP
jgi:hypothetical protein